MRPILPIRVVGLMLALALSGARAEEAPTHFDYALDEQTELTLEPKGEDGSVWAMDLRRYGSAEQGAVLRDMGDLSQVSPGVFEWKFELDQKVRSVTVTGKLGAGQPLMVTSKGLTTYTD